MDQQMFEHLQAARDRAWNSGRNDIAWTISAALSFGFDLPDLAYKDVLRALGYNLKVSKDQ